MSGTSEVYQSHRLSQQEKMNIAGAQITAARDLLKITQAELADASGVGERTLRKFEADEAMPKDSTIEKVQAELERRGIEFIDGDSPPCTAQAIGVRLNLQKAAEFAQTARQARKEPGR